MILLNVSALMLFSIFLALSGPKLVLVPVRDLKKELKTSLM